MRKRILSLVLAAAVLLGLIPTALADSPRSQRESFMAIAEAQLGYREKGRNGTKYGTWYGLPGQPWCAMFISWCARYSGVPESVIPNFSGCFGGVKWFKQHGLWRTREYTPQAGDLLFIDGLEADGTRDGLAEHVAIVERASATTIYTIEGNSINDMVERRERPRDESVLGYATPQYGSMSASAGTIRLTQVFTPRNELRGGSFKISGYVSSNKPLSRAITRYLSRRPIRAAAICKSASTSRSPRRMLILTAGTPTLPGASAGSSTRGYQTARAARDFCPTDCARVRR